MRLISLKLPDEMVDRYEHVARSRRVSRSIVLREALAGYLEAVEPIREVSVLDLAGDLIGSVPGPGDLTTNPKYMADYGK